MIKFLKKIFKQSRYERNMRKYNMGEHTLICGKAIISEGNVKIGKYSSISDYAVLGADDHPTDTLTTHFFFYHKRDDLVGDINFPKEKLRNPSIFKKGNRRLTIGNDVWIGHGAFVKTGLTIGDGAVIGAGAVVTKDVPPFAIVAGVPAKIVRYRFDQETIKELLELRWWDFPTSFIVNLPFEDVNAAIKILKENIKLRQIT